ncbi:MAG TPA: ATP-binding protein [Terriglobia bacterium]|nr:ATP-binding protein [Terriglobia bacterium]
MAEKGCPDCQGTGWKLVEVAGVSRAQRCTCGLARQPIDLLRRSRIPPRYEHCTLANFDLRKDAATGSVNGYLERAKSDAAFFVREYPNVDCGLVFTGPTGVGKTHLAVAVLRGLVERGFECLFVDFRELLQQIRESYDPVADTTELRLLQPVIESEVLLLDELVAANPSDWLKERLAYIINARYNQKKVMLITTTLAFGDAGRTPGHTGPSMPSGESIPNLERSLDQFGVTLSSRLYEMCKPIEIRAHDFRKEVKQAGYRFYAD